MIKKRYLVILYIVAVAVLVHRLPHTNAIEDPSATAFYVDPPSTIDPTLTPGNAFTVDVKVSDAFYMYSWQVVITWDDTVLTGVEVVFGGFLADQPEGSSTGIDSSRPYLWIVGESTLGKHMGKSGDGLLFSMTFQIVASAESALTIDSAATKYYYVLVPPTSVEVTDFAKLNGYFSNVPSFSLLASPSFLTIQQRDSGISAVTVTSVEGFSDTVELSVSDIPSGVTTTFDPAQVTPPPDGSATAFLTVEVDIAAVPGSYILTVVGTNGSIIQRTHIALEIIELPPPSASFSYSPIDPQVNEIVTFDASASYDPDGTIVSYDWDFGDETTGTGMIADHTYTIADTYAVTLNVTDNDGLTGTSTQFIPIAKLNSTLSISVSAVTVYVTESVRINGSITPIRSNATVTIWYSLAEEESWNVLATVATDENSKYAYTWTPSEAGTYRVQASWPGDANTLPAQSPAVTVDALPPRVLSIKLSGEHDYLIREAVKPRVVALVKDATTMEPISHVNVTIDIYSPDGNLWVSAKMTEKIAGTGIYEWESEGTIQELKLDKGLYVAHVNVSSQVSLPTSDILQFHIDPPAEELTSSAVYIAVAVSIILAAATGLILFRRLS